MNDAPERGLHLAFYWHLAAFSPVIGAIIAALLSFFAQIEPFLATYIVVVFWLPWHGFTAYLLHVRRQWDRSSLAYWGASIASGLLTFAGMMVLASYFASA